MAILQDFVDILNEAMFQPFKRSMRNKIPEEIVRMIFRYTTNFNPSIMSENVSEESSLTDQLAQQMLKLNFTCADLKRSTKLSRAKRWDRRVENLYHEMKIIEKSCVSFKQFCKDASLIPEPNRLPTCIPNCTDFSQRVSQI